MGLYKVKSFVLQMKWKLFLRVRRSYQIAAEARRLDWQAKSEEERVTGLRNEKVFWTAQLKKAHETMQLPYKRYDNERGGVIKMNVELEVKME